MNRKLEIKTVRIYFLLGQIDFELEQAKKLIDASGCLPAGHVQNISDITDMFLYRAEKHLETLSALLTVPSGGAGGGVSKRTAPPARCFSGSVKAHKQSRHTLRTFQGSVRTRGQK